MTFVPAFVSEFPDHPVTDCVPASGLMLTNKVTHNRYPASVLEREALQNAMGTQDEGANAQELCDGIRKLFGISLFPLNGWTTLVAALQQPSKGTAIFGTYQDLPAYLRNRGNQPSYVGGHCIYAQADGAGGVTIGDPLGNAMIGGATIGDLQAFAGLAGSDMMVVAQEAATIAYYRLNVPASASGTTLTLLAIIAGTQIPYARKRVLFAPRGSHATVRHGAAGFWRITDGYLAGWYAKAGVSGPFTVDAVYSDGTVKPANIYG